MSIEVIRTRISDVCVITPRIFHDERGFFFESYSQRHPLAASVDERFVQDNHSYSAAKGTVRGLHYQREPHAQIKLVRVIRGSVFDVALDIRPGSVTFGKHVGEILSAENRKQLYIPAGFAHGFCTLEDDCEVLYKTSDFYAAECEGGIRWDDPDIAIEWPVSADDAVLSQRDLQLPSFGELKRAGAAKC